jgi:trans-2,3-dihydro-3-hydroxyanthranilate isomerase
MKYRYHICDVFTGTRFGGNQLAVLPWAEGLSGGQMQSIAREFNFSETAFVFPPRAGHTRRVRIFTPTGEVPFAGHPNIGTAFVLAATGEAPCPGRVVFEEDAGPVPVTIERTPEGRIRCELQAPQPLSLGRSFSGRSVAAAVSLAPEDIVTAVHEPVVASVGLPFLLAQVRDREALARSRPDTRHVEALMAEGLADPFIHLYVRDGGEFDIRARMYAPFDGVPEDPATGSANCALAALLGRDGGLADGPHAWRIAQGVEMGRPSVLEARVEKRGGEVTGVWIGGESVMVCEGTIEVG